MSLNLQFNKKQQGTLATSRRNLPKRSAQDHAMAIARKQLLTAAFKKAMGAVIPMVIAEFRHLSVCDQQIFATFRTLQILHCRYFSERRSMMELRTIWTERSWK